jgi:hypothetical protein
MLLREAANRSESLSRDGHMLRWTKMWHLDPRATQEVINLPETGMGFQLVEAVIWGKPTPLLILNSERAIDLSEIGLLPGDDPTVILRNGLRVFQNGRLHINTQEFKEFLATLAECRKAFV